eukprot:GHVN01016084.1.p1 GENE.GHVN01016084.1~~GHVN01016084.1.p1  ORF type:complete len:413 (+),score=84.60 GHVN01016084.1:122-1360(+)
MSKGAGARNCLSFDTEEDAGAVSDRGGEVRPSVETRNAEFGREEEYGGGTSSGSQESGAKRRRVAPISVFFNIIRHTQSQNKMSQIDEMWAKKEQQDMREKAASSARQEQRQRYRRHHRDTNDSGESSRSQCDRDYDGCERDEDRVRQRVVSDSGVDTTSDVTSPSSHSPQRKELRAWREDHDVSESCLGGRDRDWCRSDTRFQHGDWQTGRHRPNGDRSPRSLRRGQQRQRNQFNRSHDEKNVYESDRVRHREEKEETLVARFKDLGNPLWRPDKYYAEIVQKPTPYLTLESILNIKQGVEKGGSERERTTTSSTSVNVAERKEKEKDRKKDRKKHKLKSKQSESTLKKRPENILSDEEDDELPRGRASRVGRIGKKTKRKESPSPSSSSSSSSPTPRKMRRRKSCMREGK